MVDRSQDGSSRVAWTFDAQEPVKLRDHAYPAAAGLGHIAARSSDTDELSPLTATQLNGRVFRDNISNRFAIRLRGFRAFWGTTVLVQEQNLSFLWWGTPTAGWDEWMAGRAANLAGWPEDRSLKTAQGTASCGGHRRGNVVIIHSIPTTSVGIHVHCC